MKLTQLALAALTLSALTAKADIIKCTFTEPYYTTTYSMAQQSLTVESIDTGKKVIKNVSFQIKGAGQFELLGKDKVVIQTLTLDNQGNDGQSPKNYPYNVKWDALSSNANSGIGGCTSNYLKATEGEN
jgi:hypothetical protein